MNSEQITAFYRSIGSYCLGDDWHSDLLGAIP